MKGKFASALSLALILAMAFASLALADNLKDDVVVGGNDTITTGGSTTIRYWIQSTGSGTGPGGCDAADGSSATVTINVPPNVTVDTDLATYGNQNTLLFNACNTSNEANPNNTKTAVFSSSIAGNYGISASVTDSNGNYNISNAAFTLYVWSTNTIPTITVNDVTKEGNNTGGWKLAFADMGSASDTEDGTPSVSCTPAIGSVLSLGSTTVTCTATDSGSLTTSDSGVVTVVDTTDPTIGDNVDLILEATGPGGAVATFGNPAASDVVDASISVVCSPASGSTFALGTTSVTCTATDDSSNSAQSSFDVTVQDTMGPTIDSHSDVGPVEATGPSGAVVSYNSPATHDAVDGDGVATCAPVSGSTFPIGNTTVTCNATDAASNSATLTTFKVTVVDTTPPTFNCASADNIWHADNQSVACSASDSGSGLATAANFSLSTTVDADNETANAYTESQLVCDLASNCVTAGPVGPFKIDRKAPSISATPDRVPDHDGWYNHALTITFSGTDGGSGGVTCAAPVNYSGPDNASASVSHSCSDAVGNSESASFNFKYDGTAPTAALSVTAGTSGANGWYISDVTVDTLGTGSVSGITCTTDQYQTTETTGQVFNGSCTSGAGLTTNAAPLTVKLDKTGPTAVMSASGTFGNNGWYISDVTIVTSGTEDISTPVSCTADQFRTTDTTGATFNGSCTNDAGLSTDADPLTVKRDTVAPSISASVSPAQSGWYNISSGAPTVTYTCSDATSGVASCTAPFTFLEGENQDHNGSTVDNAGHSALAGVTDIDVDLTVPTLAWVGGPADGGNYDFGYVPAAPTCTASDTLSGPNGCTVSGYSNSVGSQTMTALAKDKAGNEYNENRSYNVEGWVLKGFYQPVDMNGVYNIVKNGSTVPLKFEIFTKLGNVEIADVNAVTSLTYAQTACNATATTDEIETVATGGTVLRYDSTGGQFVFNWKTPATATKCYRVTMTTNDSSFLQAFFKLK